VGQVEVGGFQHWAQVTWVLHQQKGGTGGGGWVSTLGPGNMGSAPAEGWDRWRWEGSTLGPGNMAASGYSCRKPLVSTGLAISLLLCTNWLRK